MTNNPIEIDRKLKLKAMVLYILENLRPEKRTVYFIVKTAFLAHQRHLALFCVPLLQDKIKALEFGPVPSDVYDALKIARGEERIKKYHTDDALFIVWEAIGSHNERFSAKERPEMGRISPAALQCLNEALALTNAMSFDEVMQTTHQMEWNRAFNDPTDHLMNPLAIAQEGGIDKEGLSYLEYSLELDKMLH